MGLISWYQLKLFIAHASGISMDAWHILVGVVAFLLIARLLDSNVTRPLPWLVLLAAELINEAYDIHIERWPDLGSQLERGLRRPHDERLHTLFDDTTKFLVEASNAVIGYTQSDEITLILSNDGKPESQILFDSRVSKLTSVLASIPHHVEA